MSTTARVNGTVRFTFFLVMRLNITIVISCDSFIVIIELQFFSSLKLENGMKFYTLKFYALLEILFKPLLISY